jgi:hypothetical protein
VRDELELSDGAGGDAETVVSEARDLSTWSSMAQRWAKHAGLLFIPWSVTVPPVLRFDKVNEWVVTNVSSELFLTRARVRAMWQWSTILQTNNKVGALLSRWRSRCRRKWSEEELHVFEAGRAGATGGGGDAGKGSAAAERVIGGMSIDEIVAVMTELSFGVAAETPTEAAAKLFIKAQQHDLETIFGFDSSEDAPPASANGEPAHPGESSSASAVSAAASPLDSVYFDGIASDTLRGFSVPAAVGDNHGAFEGAGEDVPVAQIAGGVALTSNKCARAVEKISEYGRSSAGPSSTAPTPRAAAASRADGGSRNRARRYANAAAGPSQSTPPPPPPHPDVSQLNAEQLAAFNTVRTWHEAVFKAAGRSPSSMVSGNQLLLFVHGGPGTGKSFFIRAVELLLGGRHVCKVAMSGCAAAGIEGRTIHSTLSILVQQQRQGRAAGRSGASSADPLTSALRGGGTGGGREQSDATLSALRARFEGCRLLIIDEVSMVGCKLLADIDRQLRCAAGPNGVNLPFGGFSVLILGDYFQLDPVGDMSLHVAALSLFGNAGSNISEIYDGGAAGPSSPAASRQLSADQVHAAQLFSTFRLVEFTQQMRAAGSDPVIAGHRAFLDSLRSSDADAVDWGRFTTLYKPLTADDRDEFAGATFGVCGNLEKNAINRIVAVTAARKNGVPVITWRLEPKGQNEHGELFLEANFYSRQPQLTHYFVRGAPCTMLKNISPELGLANGSSMVFDSIVLNKEHAVQDLQTIANAEPGSIIEVHPPAYILVSPPSDSPLAQSERWPSGASLRAGKIAVPVGVCHEIKGYGPCIVAPVGGGSKRSKSGKLCKTFAAHPAELGYAFTLHRVQGRTVDRMVLELNPRLTSNGAFNIKLGLKLTRKAMYVALSRVRDPRHLRILPLRVSEKEFLSYLASLQFPVDVALWRSCYKKFRDGLLTFDKQRCLKAVREYILSKKATRAGAARGKTKDTGGPGVPRVPAKRKAAAGAAQRAPAPKRAGTAAPATTAAATPLSEETQRRQLIREGKQRARQ